MLSIDGSRGEGGGQILRTSLALSVITGTPFRMTRVRAGRAKPGLQRQHLAAVKAAADICGAELDGAELHSTVLSFTPGALAPGNYYFDVGSAGSTTLVLQTVLPPLMRAGAPSRVTIVGGTHNPFAPPIDFLQHAFLPIVNRMGPRIDVTVERVGFAPMGGGRLAVDIEPAARLSPIELLTRGPIRRQLGKAMVAGLPRTIAQRELDVVARRTRWRPDELTIEELPDHVGPGNVLTIEVQSDSLTEVFTGFGMRGTRAETVAETALAHLDRYLAADDVPVGEYLADQLLLPLALAGGGAYVALGPSSHTTTNIKTIQMFLPIRVGMKKMGEDAVRVEVG